MRAYRGKLCLERASRAPRCELFTPCVLMLLGGAMTACGYIDYEHVPTLTTEPSSESAIEPSSRNPSGIDIDDGGDQAEITDMSAMSDTEVAGSGGSSSGGTPSFSALVSRCGGLATELEWSTGETSNDVLLGDATNGVDGVDLTVSGAASIGAIGLEEEPPTDSSDIVRIEFAFTISQAAPERGGMSLSVHADSDGNAAVGSSIDAYGAAEIEPGTRMEFDSETGEARLYVDLVAQAPILRDGATLPGWTGSASQALFGMLELDFFSNTARVYLSTTPDLPGPPLLVGSINELESIPAPYFATFSAASDTGGGVRHTLLGYRMCAQ